MREFILASVEDIVQSAIGLDDDNSLDIDIPEVSFDGASENAPRQSPEVGSIRGDVGLEVELGDVGLRHRSADGTSESKMSARHES